MKFFTGSEASGIEQTVLDLLSPRLDTSLASDPYAARLPGKVAVITDENSALRRLEKSSLIAVVFLTFASGEHESKDWPSTLRGSYEIGTEHSLSVGVEVITDDKCHTMEQPLRDAVRDIVRSQRKALRLAGFFNATAAPGKAQEDEQGNKVTPFLISGTAYTLA